MARITIKDIARESGYSIGTVSRALNHMPGVSEQAREAILKVVDTHHFKINPNAKYLKQKNREGIALIVGGRDNALFADLQERLQAEAARAGYDTMVYYIAEEENEAELASHLLQQRSFQGMMFLGGQRDHLRLFSSSIPIPSVLITGSAAGLPFGNLASITTDDAQGAQFAIEYLFSRGHEEIGILGGFVDRSQTAKSRYQGVQYAFFNREKPFNPKIQYEADSFSLEGGYQAMKRLLKKFPSMTAVFAMSDLMAIGAMRAVQDAGLQVPDDLSILGFDGIPVGGYTIPRLSTIAQDTQTIALRSVQVLVDMIENYAAGVHEEIPFSLSRGESIRDRTEVPSSSFELND